MSFARRLPAVHRRWLMLLVAAALCVRALVPAGWMPVASAQGVQLGLCDGDGDGPAMLAAMPHAMPPGQGRAPMEHHHGAADHSCTYAAAAALAGPVWPDAPPLPRAEPDRLPLPPRATAAVGRGLAAPPPPPTGPPAFA